MKEKIIGFDSELEKDYLSRFSDIGVKRRNLQRELETQLGEDFGVIEFTFKYKFNDEGKIVSLLSDDSVVELTERGGVEEETESIKKIERGLKDDPNKLWIRFSPRNGKLGYPENCVDFWRNNNGELIWNRIYIKDDFEKINEVRSALSGEEKKKDEMDILKSPIGVDLRIIDVFDFFRLKDAGYISYKKIEKVVDDFLYDFDYDFGEELFRKSFLIDRLYSACYDFLSERKGVNFDIWDYMYGQRLGERIENSFGCAAATTVGSFGEKIGYFIVDGKVSYGEIPSGFKECKQCGCWYFGEKCPFC